MWQTGFIMRDLMTGDNVTERQWDDPLDFKKEGIVLDYKTAGVDIDANLNRY